MQNVQQRRYALMFYTEEKGWLFAGKLGLLTANPANVPHYSDIQDAINAAHKEDAFQDRYHEVVELIIQYHWDTPRQVRERRTV